HFAGPAAFECCDVGLKRFAQAFRQHHQPFDLARVAHLRASCNCSNWRATGPERPKPPCVSICLPYSSNISERNIASPGPPPKGPSVGISANIWPKNSETNTDSNCC